MSTVRTLADLNRVLGMPPPQDETSDLRVAMARPRVNRGTGVRRARRARDTAPQPPELTDREILIRLTLRALPFLIFVVLLTVVAIAG